MFGSRRKPYTYEEWDILRTKVCDMENQNTMKATNNNRNTESLCKWLQNMLQWNITKQEGKTVIKHKPDTIAEEKIEEVFIYTIIIKRISY